MNITEVIEMKHQDAATAKSGQQMVRRGDCFACDLFALSKLHGRRLDHFERIPITLVDSDDDHSLC